MAKNDSGNNLGRGFALVVIGCVLIAIGLSFGGRLVHLNWGRKADGDFEFRLDRSAAGSDAIRTTVAGEVPSTTHRLVITAGASRVSVIQGASFSYRLVDFPENQVSVELSGNTVRITEDSRITRFSFGARGVETRIEVTIPSGVRLEECRITLGAGTLVIEDIDAAILTLETGAGSVTASRVKAEKTRVETGAGQAVFKDVSFASLTASTGAGQVVLQGDITKDAEISTGAGAIELSLSGSEKDYRFETERGLGAVRIGSSSWAGPGSGIAGNPEAPVRIKLNSGIGSVRVRFDR